MRLQFWSSWEWGVTPFIAIFPWFTLTLSVGPYISSIYRSYRSIWKLLVLERNTWNQITVYKSFVLEIVTWTYIFQSPSTKFTNLYIFINPSPWAECDIWSIFMRSMTCLNSKISYVKEPSLSNYLPIAGRRIVGFIPFPRVLALYEIQTSSSRIWAQVTMSISYDDNHCTTSTSLFHITFAI